MTKKNIVIVADYTESSYMSIDEVSGACRVSPDFIQALIEYGVIEPYNDDRQQLIFDLMHLQRIQKAKRLQHDLEVNLAGIAIVLDLLDDMQTLRERVVLLEKHVLKR